jgi:hypothetical protein
MYLSIRPFARRKAILMTAAIAAARRTRTPQRYIIDGIMPVHQIHLLAGPSGGGKTTLVFQMMESIVKGNEFLGHACKTVQQAYISCDRNIESVYATMDRMNMDIDIPMWSTIDNNINNNFPAILAFVMLQVPNLKLLHVDGFTSLCPRGNITDYDTVANHLRGITRKCAELGITVNGLCHDAKLKQGHEYIMERERVIGSSAWGGYSDTILHISPANPKDATDQRRAIAILPRNSCNEALTYAMDKGRLVPCDSANETVELYLLSQDILRHPIDMIRTADIVTYAAAHGVGRSKAYTYIEKLIDSAKIERVTAGGREKGMYRRVIPS